MKHFNIAATVFVLVLVVATLADMSAAICPYCNCPPSYAKVCARRKDNGIIRGFSSRCVLDCTNMCRPPGKKFEFLKRGRCKNLRPKPTTTTTVATNKLK